MKGKILKGIGGFYYVLDENKIIHECKAAGRFRKEGVTPLPGDNVIFVPEGDSYGFIEQIEDRINLLTRPRVAN
ncbi:MAG: ribosome biogenesis GTPase RsgA, partial [Clostridia bacterium]|nr:ribosome biogenesis GTPase RsgA [Clostridia bacterium]